MVVYLLELPGQNVKGKDASTGKRKVPRCVKERRGQRKATQHRQVKSLKDGGYKTKLECERKTAMLMCANRSDARKG